MNPQLYNIRHSLAHILAQAVQRYLDPKVQLGTGPAIENGFYYDMMFSEEKSPQAPFTKGGAEQVASEDVNPSLVKEGASDTSGRIQFGEDHLKRLSKLMEGVVKEGQKFGSYTAKSFEEAVELCNTMGQSFKVELLTKFKEQGETNYTFYYNYVDAQMLPRLEKACKPEYIAMYTNLSNDLKKKGALEESQFVTFVDLCEGGHVENTKEIVDGSFALEKIAGAYWQGKEGNPQMTRVYGLAFETKDELKAYQTMMEEAKKRDHRIIGAKMKLFTISDLVGSGLPLFQPNGMIIRKAIEDYLRELHKTKGYSRVWTPHIAKEDLYNTSGHAKHYLEDMFKVHGGTSNEDFYLKPMNCPHHMQLFADNQFSYRDMPIRYFEPATVYRDEKTGQLAGLTRVRCITQDDGHLFCRVGQIKQECSTIVEIIKEFFGTMGMLDGYRVSLSVRGEDKEKYLGTEEVRQTAEGALREICNELQLNYKEVPGEAAFYGPKLDFMFKDAIGRQHQLSTIQIDFNLPERFKLSFVNEQGEDERPVVIHRAISGSLERCMGVMIEHFAGAFPVWLAPKQVVIIPVAEPFNDYAFSLKTKLTGVDIRASVHDSDDSFSKKIRNAELDKVPYILIVGEKEQADGTVSVREFRSKKQYVMGVEEFLEKVSLEFKERRLESE